MPLGVYQRTKDHCRHISESHLKEKHPMWKGGLYCYFHNEARKLFGKPFCEYCGISREEYLRSHTHGLNMHCVSGDFRTLEQWNWNCICALCHSKLHDNKCQSEEANRKRRESCKRSWRIRHGLHLDGSRKSKNSK